MSPPRPDWTVGVCGFGRCGSTMTMAMLEAGGCPPTPDAMAGSYETSEEGMRRPQQAGHAIKLLDGILYGYEPPAAAWRFVWLDRDPAQQATSILKLLGVAADVVDEGSVIASLDRDRPIALGLLRTLGPVLVLQYEQVLANPRRAARMLRKVWPALDVDAAAAAVHARDGRCRPDLAFELSISRGEPS